MVLVILPRSFFLVTQYEYWFFNIFSIYEHIYCMYVFCVSVLCYSKDVSLAKVWELYFLVD